MKIKPIVIKKGKINKIAITVLILLIDLLILLESVSTKTTVIKATSTQFNVELKDGEDVEGSFLSSIDLLVDILERDGKVDEDKLADKEESNRANGQGEAENSEQQVDESTANISSYATIMKYIYWKYTGDDKFGVKELDFSAYDTSEFSESSSNQTYKSKNIPDAVLKLKDKFLKAAKRYGIEEYIDVLLAICTQETHGNETDVMQCGASSVDESINTGTRIFSEHLKNAGGDLDIALQAYNFGGAYISFAKQRGGHSKENAVEFAKIHSGGRQNPPGSALGKWRYGDQNYVEHVKQYFEINENSEESKNIKTKLTGKNKEKMEKMIARAIQIANDEDHQYYTYSQEHRNDKYQYDCSSFCARLYKKYFGIDIPNTTRDYKTKWYVGPVGSVKLQPGDVLWREGHVELYIGNNKRAGAHSPRYPDKDQISIESGVSGFTKVYRFVN